MQFRNAVPSDSEALCDLMNRLSIGGDGIRLSRDREPDFFQGAQIQTEEPQVFVGEDEEGWDVFCGMNAGTRKVYVNRQPTKLRYLTDARLEPAYRGGTLLARGLKHLKKEIMGEMDVAQVMLFGSDSIELFASGRPNLPTFSFLGDYGLHFLPAQTLPIQSKLKVRPAKATDIPMMQRLLEREGAPKAFFPCYQLKDLGEPYYLGLEIGNYQLAYEGKTLVGILGVWDQSDSQRLRSRETYESDSDDDDDGIVASIAYEPSRQISLDSEGMDLSTLFLHTAVVRDNEAEIFRFLLSSILADSRWAPEFWVIGLDEADGLNEALRGVRKRTLRGKHFLASFAGELPAPKGPFYVEAARL